MEHTLGEECKKEGNDCMEKEKYYEAVIHYTKGIKLDPHNAHIYSNRSCAFLKIQQYFHALEDAKSAIRILPKWAKGYFRKGEVECAVEHYKEAMETYGSGLAVLPDDPTLLKCLENATELWHRQREAENRMPWYGITLGAVVGILLIVADEAVAKKPMLKNDLLRTVVLAGLVLICYGIALLYRYFVRSQRDGMIDAPIDLMNDDDAATILKPFGNCTPATTEAKSSANSSKASRSSDRKKKNR